MNKMNDQEKVRNRWRILIVLYILVIVKLIIFKYPLSILRVIMENWGSESIRSGVHSANFVPFKTIKMYIRYYESLNSFENLFGNILIFIPFGFFLPKAFVKMNQLFWTLLFSGCFIIDIELFQLVTRFGEFDVDDIILNLLGVVIGFSLYHLIHYILKKSRHMRSRK